MKLEPYQENGRIKKPVLMMYAFFSMWQMTVMWVSSTTGYIAKYSQVQMPGDMNYTYLSYAGIILIPIILMIFPKICMKLLRISAITALICVTICFFPLKDITYNIIFCILTLTAASLTVCYISYMVYTFKLKDIWFELMCEIFLIGISSLFLLNGKMEISFTVFNTISFIALALCTSSYFLLKDEGFEYVKKSKTKPPYLLIAFLLFTLFASIFTLTIITILPTIIKDANIYIFSGQIISGIILIFMYKKNVNYYNMISALSIMLVIGLSLIAVKLLIPFACLLLGAAGAISIIGLVAGAYAYKRYPSRFIGPLMPLLSGLSVGIGEITYRLIESIELYLGIMISICVVFTIVYQFLVPFIQYKLGYGSISILFDYPFNANNILMRPEPIKTTDVSAENKTETMPSSAGMPDAMHTLTQRETDITRLILSGYTGTQIASTLFISLSTVKTHTKNIYSKLGINTKKELFDIALNNENHPHIE